MGQTLVIAISLPWAVHQERLLGNFGNVVGRVKSLQRSARRHRRGKVVDVSLLKRYSMFVLEVVKAHAPSSPKYPQTIHYRGDGVFMVSGRSISFRKKFKKENL